MGSNIKQLNVFIASPGDVSDERDIVEKVIENLNKNPLVEDKKLQLKTYRWENIRPQAGRPQEITNKYARDCDIFIGIMHRRFGMPTGKEESGTLEEFKIAYDLWTRKKKPEIMFYFKEVKIASLKDATDEQLLKVLEFKEEIETKHKLIHGGFAETHEFDDLFKNNVEQLISDRDKGASETEKSAPPLTIPFSYFTWLKERCSSMEVEKLGGKGKAIRVDLPEIFVPLYAMDPDAKKHAEIGDEEKQKAVNIEELIDRNEYLLIEGQAGSGKTTLLKHYAYQLAEETERHADKPVLPVLIFLRDLKPYLDEKKVKEINIEAVLKAFLEAHEQVISYDTLCGFCDANRAILLLDGLDEVSEDYRDKLINAFAAFRARHNLKIVLSGRPHGLQGAAIGLFGKRHVQVLSFNQAQVHEFIRKWFKHIYGKNMALGKKTAKEMLGEIKENESIQQLVDNPLMLTAICILYYDGKQLPEQRAELYKKFVENMIYRRFEKPEKVNDFLKELAYRMQLAGAKGMDRCGAIDALSRVFAREGKEGEKEYKKRLENLFDDIEPKCGLLKLEGGQYGFWHLTFQEFLTAVYIVDNHTQFDAAIKDYWEKEGFSEVIKLFIGYLSMEYKSWSTKIVQQAVTDEASNTSKIILAGEALVDIQQDRRGEELVKEAKARFWREIDESDNPKTKAVLGEIIGRLGDDRDFKEFIKIPGEKYHLERIGTKKIKPFELAKYPVTNFWYGEFMEAGGYENQKYWSHEGWQWRKDNGILFPEYWHERKWKVPNLPVVGVSWYEAEAFTKWVAFKEGYDCRLPTEEEWQAAAAGFDNRKNPWGEGIDELKCNYKRIIGKTSAVGIFKLGDTPEGLSDMGGNVWEWTNSFYDNKNREHVLRGGSWVDDGVIMRCAVRVGDFPDVRDGSTGFRCAR